MRRIPSISERVFHLKADFLKALAHPVRLAAIEELKSGESSVGRLARKMRVEQSSLSKHLAILRGAGILTSRQEKAAVLYSIRDREILRILRLMAEMLRKQMKESRAVLNRLTRA